MSSIEEDGLDKLFKKGLKEPGRVAEYREADWDAFEKMLDEKDEKRPIVFWLPIISGIAALIVLGFGWFYFQSNNNTVPKQQVAVRPVNKNNNQALTQVNAGTDKKDNTGLSGGPEHQLADGANKIPPSVTRAGDVAQVVKNYRKGKSFLSLSGTAARRLTAGLTDNVKKDVVNDVEPEPFPSGWKNDITALSEQNIPNGELIGANNLPALPVASEAAITEIKDIVKGTNFNKNRPQYAITVLGSSNINGVGSFSQAQVGTNLGLLFSVGVSKFSFSTGAIYAKTPYTANASNYNVGYPAKHAPDNISADCRVLDIPLNVDYRVYSKAKNQFSIGSGLSSYIMLNENYNYTYSGPYAPLYPSSLSLTNQNRYFLGVLNLDATFQRKLSAKLSFDVQPYLKIPLTGIGAGDVKLQTAGVALGLSWNLNRLFKP